MGVLQCLGLRRLWLLWLLCEFIKGGKCVRRIDWEGDSCFTLALGLVFYIEFFFLFGD